MRVLAAISHGLPTKTNMTTCTRKTLPLLFCRLLLRATLSLVFFVLTSV
jgi:hypothetical protein